MPGALTDHHLGQLGGRSRTSSASALPPTHPWFRPPAGLATATATAGGSGAAAPVAGGDAGGGASGSAGTTASHSFRFGAPADVGGPTAAAAASASLVPTPVAGNHVTFAAGVPLDGATCSSRGSNGARRWGWGALPQDWKPVPLKKESGPPLLEDDDILTAIADPGAASATSAAAAPWEGGASHGANVRGSAKKKRVRLGGGMDRDGGEVPAMPAPAPPLSESARALAEAYTRRDPAAVRAAAESGSTSGREILLQALGGN